jgi:hypothetical protein
VRCLKSDELRSVNIFSANIFAILRSVHLIICLFNCIIGTLQATEGNTFLKGRTLVSALSKRMYVTRSFPLDSMYSYSSNETSFLVNN